jgi:hypothetical protein
MSFFDGFVGKRVFSLISFWGFLKRYHGGKLVGIFQSFT